MAAGGIEMCGRYLFSEAEAEDILEIIRDVEGRTGAGTVKRGEIFPTDSAPILLARDRSVRPELFVWGFPGFRGKNVIINARAETAHEKPMFRRSLAARRCVIPSTGFFEWGIADNDGTADSEVDIINPLLPVTGTRKGKPKKQKYLFRIPGEKVLYMAGLYNIYQDGPRFVILTTAANESMMDVHDRMPLILRRELIEDWLFDDGKVPELLRQSPVLEKTAV